MQKNKPILIATSLIATILLGQIIVWTQATEKGEYPLVPLGLMQAEFVDIDDTSFRLNEFKGKVVLVNILGLWCGPCRVQIPSLIDLQKKYGDRGFVVIGLDIGDGSGVPESVREIKLFAGSFGIHYYLARSAKESTNEFYRVTKQQVVPQTILIDRQGRLRGIFIGGGPRVEESLNKTMDEVMNEK